MKNLLVFSFSLFLLSSSNFMLAQLPVLDTVLTAECGSVFYYGHKPTGKPDPVGIYIKPNRTCLINIDLKHDAYVILDQYQVWVKNKGFWFRIYEQPWHSGVVFSDITIPAMTDSVMVVVFNNLIDFTAWELWIGCTYDPYCCNEKGPNFVLTGPEIACPGDLITVKVDSLKGRAPFSFTWSTGDTTQNSSFFINKTTEIFINVFDSLGCKISQSIKVEVPPPPVIFKDTTVCTGAIVCVPKGQNIIWQGDTCVLIENDFNFVGILIDTVIGCDFEIPFEVFVQKKPFVSQDTVVCENSLIQIKTEGVNAEWFDIYGNKIFDGANFYTVINQDTIFVVEMNDKEIGCFWRDTINIGSRYCLDRYFVPNVINPDLQNTNSFWKLSFPDDSYGEVYVQNIQIWGRWGEHIFQSIGPEFFWDGIFRGKKVPPGVYVWTAEIVVQLTKDRIFLKGDVTVVR